MTTEELLQPRFEVINDYPNHKFEIGRILERIERATNDHYGTIHKNILLEDLKKYPHIFRELAWWESRSEDKLPKYLRCVKTPDQLIMPDVVMKITEYFNGNCGRSAYGICVLDTDCFVPATEEEYNQYNVVSKNANESK